FGAHVPSWWRTALPGLRSSHQRTPATPGRASTDWFVTSVSCVPKLRYWSRQSGRCRYDRMSRNCDGSVMPGCGRQSRLVGAHGKTVSYEAIGTDFSNANVAAAGLLQSTFAWKTFSPSNGAWLRASSSIEPTKYSGLPAGGCLEPSRSAGRMPSPTWDAGW